MAEVRRNGKDGSSRRWSSGAGRPGPWAAAALFPALGLAVSLILALSPASPATAAGPEANGVNNGNAPAPPPVLKPKPQPQIPGPGKGAPRPNTGSGSDNRGNDLGQPAPGCRYRQNQLELIV